MSYCYSVVQDPATTLWSEREGQGPCFAAINVQQGAEAPGMFEFCRLECFRSFSVC